MFPGQCPSAFLDFISVTIGGFWWSFFSANLFTKTFGYWILSRLLNGIGLLLILKVLYNRCFRTKSDQDDLDPIVG